MTSEMLLLLLLLLAAAEEEEEEIYSYEQQVSLQYPVQRYSPPALVLVGALLQGQPSSTWSHRHAPASAAPARPPWSPLLSPACIPSSPCAYMHLVL